MREGSDGFRPVGQHHPHHQTAHRHQQKRALEGLPLSRLPHPAGGDGGEEACRRHKGQSTQDQGLPLREEPVLQGGGGAVSADDQLAGKDPGGDVRRAGDRQQQDAHHRQGQQARRGGGEAVRKEGGVLPLRREKGPGGEKGGRRQHHEPQDQRHGRKIAGDGQAGVRLEPGGPLDQPQQERPRAAHGGQQGKEHTFFHRRDLLITTELRKRVYHGTGGLSMAASFSACRAHTVEGQARDGRQTRREQPYETPY